MTDQMKENNIKVAVAIIQHNTCSGITEELDLNCRDCHNILCCRVSEDASVSMEIYLAKRLINTRKWLGDNVLTKQNINTGIQIGLNSLANQGAQKQNQLQQQAIQLQKGQDQLKQKLPATKTGSNTMLYVWIGVGVLTVTILGVILYKQNKK